MPLLGSCWRLQTLRLLSPTFLRPSILRKSCKFHSLQHAVPKEQPLRRYKPVQVPLKSSSQDPRNIWEAAQIEWRHYSSESELSEKQVLGTAQLLHQDVRQFESSNEAWVNSRLRHLTGITELYCQDGFPRSTMATMHLLGAFRDLGHSSEGLRFFIVLRNLSNEPIPSACYGAAIELMAIDGAGLSFCEQVYEKVLKHHSQDFSEYHMTDNAAAEDLNLPTLASGASLSLLAGITFARLYHDDWKSAYLSLDTALRLQPCQISQRFGQLFYEMRPLQESIQVYMLILQGGNFVRPQALRSILTDLHRCQDPNSGSSIDIELALHGINLIRLYIAGDNTMDGELLVHLLNLLLATLPYQEVSTAKLAPDSETEQNALWMIGSLLDLLPTLGFRVKDEHFWQVLESLDRAGMYDAADWLTAKLPTRFSVNEDPMIHRMSFQRNVQRNPDDIKFFWNEYTSKVPQDSSHKKYYKPLIQAAYQTKNTSAWRAIVEEDGLKAKDFRGVAKTCAMFQQALRDQKVVRDGIKSSIGHTQAQASIKIVRAELERLCRDIKAKEVRNLAKSGPLEFRSFTGTERLFSKSLNDIAHYRAVYAMEPLRDAKPTESAVEPAEDGDVNENPSYSPGVSLSKTNLPYQDLRLRYWGGITRILKQAELYETSLAAYAASQDKQPTVFGKFIHVRKGDAGYLHKNAIRSQLGIHIENMINYQTPPDQAMRQETVRTRLPRHTKEQYMPTTRGIAATAGLDHDPLADKKKIWRSIAELG